MLNAIKVFDVMHVDLATGRSVWTGLTGARTALKRDGHMIHPKAMAYCPIEWLDERGNLDTELAASAPLEHLATGRNDSMFRSRVP